MLTCVSGENAHTVAACISETSDIRAGSVFGRWSICVCYVFYCRLKTTEHGQNIVHLHAAAKRSSERKQICVEQICQ